MGFSARTPGLRLRLAPLLLLSSVAFAGEVKPKQLARLERGNASYRAMFEQYRKDGI